MQCLCICYLYFDTKPVSLRETNNRKQSFFGEHEDDIVSLAVFLPPSMYSVSSSSSSSSEPAVLIASGELGKKPAIHLYTWSSQANAFESLACISGYHTKGVLQLAFSKDGNKLFSVGLEYSVAVYDCNPSSPTTLGRMVGSSQGPKSSILHVCCCSNGGGVDKFVTCGEKHLCVWTCGNGNPKCDNGKIGAFKNKFILCCTGGEVW